MPGTAPMSRGSRPGARAPQRTTAPAEVVHYRASRLLSPAAGKVRRGSLAAINVAGCPYRRFRLKIDRRCGLHVDSEPRHAVSPTPTVRRKGEGENGMFLKPSPLA